MGLEISVTVLETRKRKDKNPVLNRPPVTPSPGILTLSGRKMLSSARLKAKGAIDTGRAVAVCCRSSPLDGATMLRVDATGVRLDPLRCAELCPDWSSLHRQGYDDKQRPYHESEMPGKKSRSKRGPRGPSVAFTNACTGGTGGEVA